jgi:hypothetical protein
MLKFILGQSILKQIVQSPIVPLTVFINHDTLMCFSPDIFVYMLATAVDKVYNLHQ